MRITNLDRSSIYPDLSDRQHVTLPEAEREGLRTGLKAGDILISITADIGIIGYVDERIPFPAYINQHVACLRLPQDQVWPKFVAYYLASAEPQKRFIEMTDVGAKTGINLTTVSKLTFPCPPLPEQQAIAAALSDADGVVAGLERVIGKKRLIKQGAMQDLLTARRRLPGFSGEWEEREIDSIALILDNLRVPLNDTQRKAIPGSIPYCGANGVVDHVGQHLIDDDVILMAEDGGYFDEYQTRPIAYRMIGKIWVNNHAHVLKARAGFNHGFLFHSLRHKDITPFLASGTRAKLNKGELKKISIFAPKDEREQATIAALLNDMDTEIQTLESRLAKARAVKEGMMQNLLTGRVRLV